jgi:DNA-3-methyladenine glycosylase
VTPLPKAFYERDTQLVARELLGKWLVHRTAGQEYMGRIVETEAYLGPHDLAAHSCRGKTARTAVMFGPAGFAYVYLIYGMYHCMNVVTEPEGHGAAVLIRAVEPVRGITQKSNGPGLLCRAMEITRLHNALSLLGEELFVTDDSSDVKPQEKILSSARIGVSYAGAWASKPLRFYLANNAWVSKGKPSVAKA